MQIAIAKRALLGDRHCGDDCAWWHSGGKTTLCIVDGLGHGEHAERAATAAVEYVAGHLTHPLADIFAGCDAALRRTRGVVMSIAVVDEEAETLTHAGIGNTRAMIVGEEKTVHLSSNYGIVGGGYRRLTPETVTLNPGDLVIMYTDGIPEKMNLLNYDATLRGDVQQLAAQIVQGWGRETDDVAVLVFRSEEA